VTSDRIWIPCRLAAETHGPNEVVVEVATLGGAEEVVVDRSLVSDGMLRCALVGMRGDDLLLELPRESCRGQWRVWTSGRDGFHLRTRIHLTPTAEAAP
jgi:hypothetical protein